MIIFKTFEEPEACMHALTHPETRGPGNAHAAENEVAGGVAAGPRVGVATRELQKRAAKGKRQRGAEDAQNSSFTPMCKGSIY